MRLRTQIEQQQQLGGGAPSASLPTIPTPTPPVSPNAQAVTDVQQAQARQNLRRRSISSTMMGAGATGGYTPSTNASTTGAGASGSAPSVSSGGTKTG